VWQELNNEYSYEWEWRLERRIGNGEGKKMTDAQEQFQSARVKAVVQSDRDKISLSSNHITDFMKEMNDR